MDQGIGGMASRPRVPVRAATLASSALLAVVLGLALVGLVPAGTTLLGTLVAITWCVAAARLVRPDHYTTATTAFAALLVAAVLLRSLAYPSLGISSAPLDSELQGIPGTTGSHDSMRYEVFAEEQAKLWRNGAWGERIGSLYAQYAFPFTLALLDWGFGASPINAIYLNTLMVGMMALGAYRLVLPFSGGSDARGQGDGTLLALLLTLAFPLVVVQGAAITMKEASVGAALIIGMASVEALRAGRRWPAALALVLSAVALFQIRFYMILPLLVFGAIRVRHMLRAWRGILALSGVVIAAVGLIALLLQGSIIYGVLFEQQAEYVASLSEGLSEGGITAATYWNFSPARAWLIPVRGALILFNPFPPLQLADYHVGSESANVVMLILLLPLLMQYVLRLAREDAMEVVAQLSVPVTTLLVISALLPISSPRFLVPMLPVVAAQLGARRNQGIRMRPVAYVAVVASITLTGVMLYSLMRAAS